jgi:hypothetical protein
MTWEQRLREMLLAGGALAAGCSSHAAATGSTGDASADGAELGDGAVGGCCGPSSSACCNTGVDPCTGAPAASSAQCISAQLACESDGGTFTVSFGPGNAINAACELPIIHCCNANPDPCCSCNGTAQNPELCSAETQCAAGGGHYDLLLEELVDGRVATIQPGCVYPDGGGSDAAPRDAGDGDGPD